MTSRGEQHRKPCWEVGSGTCFPLHSSPWPSRCSQRLSTRTRNKYYANNHTVPTPRGSDSIECTDTERIGHSRVLAPRGPDTQQLLRILLLDESPYTGFHTYVYSSAACLRLLAAAAYSAAAARASAVAVAAVEEGSPYTGLHTYVCSSAACLRLLAAAAYSAAAARASAVAVAAVEGPHLKGPSPYERMHMRL